MVDRSTQTVKTLITVKNVFSVLWDAITHGAKTYHSFPDISIDKLLTQLKSAHSSHVLCEGSQLITAEKSLKEK